MTVTPPQGAGTSQVFYIYSDQIDTAREITDAAGVKVWQADPDPFGANLPDENPSGKGKFTFNPRFPGQYFDAETGLHYNYFRDYDPQIGRYIQSDPIGLDGGINTYGYVGGNPLSYSDPNGLQPYSPLHRVPRNQPSKVADHTYHWKVFRCMGNCVAQSMRDLRCNPGPGAHPDKPVNSGDINILGVGPVTIGPIMTAVDTDNNAVYNLTVPGHLLYPGWVKRQVVFDGHATWVDNSGGGTGFNPLNSNAWLAPIVWGGRSPANSAGTECGCEK